ncbi:MAG: chemotaxis protein CheA, partial [Polyangiaceae bacterium]|nr:chemotaxis protein CheA [Polyangiaceae bacterium]
DGLESLKTTLKRFGEILTYLPTGGGTEADRIELEVLLASAEQLDRVRVGIAELNATVDELPRLSNSPGSPPVATDMPPVPIAQAPQPASSKERAMGLPLRMTMGSEPNISIVGSASPAPAPRADNSLRSVSQTVRVDIQRLDHLMNLLGELAIVRGGIARLLERTRVEPSMREVARDLGRLHHGFERHLATMQTAILEVRMVPLGQVFEKLARVARQTSREVHKDVNLVITGAETEVDKLIGEELSDPLMHMIRNALDHGVEEASQRLAVGKPEAGTIALNAYPKGNQVVVEVEDDGAGIDEKSLLKAAVDAHVVTREEASELSRRERLALIFAPGVTTRSDAGKLSGRGVGMDVVKTNIGRLGGVVDVHSELGIGTKFTITLPITLAMISALMVRVSDNIYAVPLSSVQEAVLVDVRAVRTLQGRQLVTMRGESLPLCFLDVLFGDRRAGVSPGARKLLIVVASAASCRCGFVVDDILGRQDIIIKALSGPLRGAPGFAGATELGDQRVGLVLDIPALLEEALTGIAGPRVLGMVTDA